MSLPQALALTEDTVYKMLIAQVHVGSENLDDQMRRYIWKCRADGQFIINLQYTWDKLVLAARIIAAVENPKDIAVISARDWGQRAVLKFAHYTQCSSIAGRFTPGTFTNQQQQKDFKEPRLIIVTDTQIDHQPLLEASYVNIPSIAFANSDSPIKYVDVVIPCNNAAPQAIGLMYWLLCREVLRLRGTISREEEWNIMPDLFFWRDPTKEEEGKEEGQEDVAGRTFTGDDVKGGFQSGSRSGGGSEFSGGASAAASSGKAPDTWVVDDNASGGRSSSASSSFNPPWTANTGGATTSDDSESVTPTWAALG